MIEKSITKKAAGFLPILKKENIPEMLMTL